MKNSLRRGGLLSLALLGACTMKEDLRTVELQVGGSSTSLFVTWREGAVLHSDSAGTPWTHTIEAADGAQLVVRAVAPREDAALWIRVLEDGQEVRVAPGCRCDGSGVSAQVDGVVGAW